jgi:GntR family transcriptional regulator
MKIELKDSSHGPVYAQVREQLEGQIRAGQRSPGQGLPSPASLARELSVDLGEIQRAYFELEHVGLVKKESAKDFLGKLKTTYQVK